MSDPVRAVPLLPGEMPSRWRVWRTWLLKTLPGRALVLAAIIKAITWPLGLLYRLPGALEAIDMVGSLALLLAGAYGVTRLAVWAKRRLLWRVRRKLILSYIFVGVVPALLVITFFLLAGMILAFNVSSYLVQSRVRNLTDQARFLAQTVQLEAQRTTSPDALMETLERRQAEQRDALSVPVDRGRPGIRADVHGRTGAGRADPAHAAGAAAAPRRSLGTSAAPADVAEVDWLRRILGPGGLHRAAAQP